MSGKKPNPQSAKRAIEKCARVINGRSITTTELASASPVSIPLFGPEQASVFIKHAFMCDDHVALQAARWSERNDRVVPSTWAHVHLRDDYAALIKTPNEWRSITEGDLGAYYRINPGTKRGTGYNGVYTDQDIVRFPHLLIEHDDLDIHQQLALLCALPLPILALVSTGGKSIHGIVRVDACDANHFRSLTVRLHRYLDKLGFDKSNKIPSRLSRLPGVLRRIEVGADPARQELLYLDPNPRTGTCIFDKIQSQPTTEQPK